MMHVTPDYTFHHTIDTTTNPKEYTMHNHYNSYEILIFLKGDADFIIEGSVYPLKPYDIILLNPNEFHHVLHHQHNQIYERIVLHLNSSFFTKNNCDEFRHMFYKKKPGTQNMIPGSFAIENNIIDIVSRTEKYLFDKNGSIAVRCTILELLHVLNKSHHPVVLSENHAKITPIIMYINENLTSPLSIDNIAETFFLNKYHLCRLFKKHTGLTINKYITHKRMIMVRNLCREGKTISQASMEAGFGNYSNFYRMYLKEYGRSPKEDIRDIKQ